MVQSEPENQTMTRLLQLAEGPLAATPEQLRSWRHGVIDVRSGRLVAIRRRWRAKSASLLGTYLHGAWYHRRVSGDRCLLFYNQPLRIPDFLTLAYVVSTRQCTFGTFCRAAATLDEIARIKGADALLCHVGNTRISQRLLVRYGWQQHTSLPGRHYIKRFRPAERIWTDEPGDERRVKGEG